MSRRTDPSAGVVPPVRVDVRGESGPTRRQVRSRRWRRSSYGFYVPSDVDGDVPEQRIAEASVAIPEVGGLTGWAALRWCGAEWFDGTTDGGRTPRDVDLATCYADIRNQAGIHVCQERLNPLELTFHDGLPMTEPVRSVFFEARYAKSLSAAVCAFDMAAYADLLSLDEYEPYAFWHRGWTGVEQARKVALLGEENSWSPMETRVRLRWVLELRLPPPLCNMPLFDDAGRHIATPDLFDLDRGLAVEYEGAVHLTTARRAADRDRETRMREHGIEVAVVVRSDFERDLVVGRLRHAVEQAERTFTRRPRLWTAEQPTWWRATHTVAQRRALAADGLAHLLPSRRSAA